MSVYGCFSEYYDILTEDVDYKGRADYLYGLFKRFDKAPTLLLDLACGTGGFSLEFAKKGIDVIGVEPSEEMLSVAREKSAKENLDVLYLCQTGQELDLYGTVDGAVCCLDSINHITDENELQALFSRVSLFLEQGRLFIFDVNTEYKHEIILADNTFVRETDDLFLVWQNFYSPQNKTTNICLDFFTESDGVYIRESEDFAERAYSHAEIEKIIKNAGLEIVALYGDMTFEEPKEDSQRNIYIVRKV